MYSHCILLSGYATSGKDTLGKYLVSKYNYTRVAIADILKTYISEKYGLDINIFYSQEGKKSIIYNGMTARELLIKEAMFFRNIDENFWINKTIDYIKTYGIKRVVITDFRFPNEYRCIKSSDLFGKSIVTVRIERDNIEIIESISESSLDDFPFDHYIKNNSSVEDLYKNFDKIIL